MGRSKRSRRGQPPGIREIATALGVSIGTVDRALHDRPGISPGTRARVLETAKALAYRPNLAARFLSSQRRLRIGVVLPREIASFWDLVRDGFLQAARLFEPNGVQIVARSYPHFGQGEREALGQALEDDIDGLVIAPGVPAELAPLLRRAGARKIAMVFVNTDAPSVQRLAAVYADPTISGSMVAELMGRFLGGRGRVLLVTGQLSTLDHAQKVEGFRNTVRELWPRLEIAALVEAHDDAAEAYAKCRAVLACNADVAGVYVSTANSLPVLQALDEHGLAADRVTVIATDLFADLAPHIERGRVASTIDQRPWMQGQMAFHTLYRFLTERVVPAPVVRVSPHVVMRSNLKLFLERLRSVPEGSPAMVSS